MTRKVTVEICTRDPNDLQTLCQSWCDDHLADYDHTDCDDAADALLRGYLATIDERTTGADALSVAVTESAQ